jgi:hypothetical protein
VTGRQLFATFAASREVVPDRKDRTGRREDAKGKRSWVCRSAKTLLAASDCWRSRRKGDLSPRWGWFSWGDGTQRSRAGLSSGGPPGLGPRLGSGLWGLVSCRWWTSWLNSGEGFNHQPHKGHDKNMARTGRLGNLGNSATTAMRLVFALGSDPGLSSFLGQPWAWGLNAVGVGGAGAWRLEAFALRRGAPHAPACHNALDPSRRREGEAKE